MGYVKYKLGYVEDAYEIFSAALKRFNNTRWFLLSKHSAKNSNKKRSKPKLFVCFSYSSM